MCLNARCRLAICPEVLIVRNLIMEKRKVRKRKVCFVPNCGSNSENSPEKLFFSLPAEVGMRKIWAEAVGRRGNETIFNPSSSVFCCEDHFNLSEDILNYGYARSMGGRMRLKPGTLPQIYKKRKAEDLGTKKRTMAKLEFLETLKFEPLIDVPAYCATHDANDPLASFPVIPGLEYVDIEKLEPPPDVPSCFLTRDDNRDPLEIFPTSSHLEFVKTVKSEPLAYLSSRSVPHGPNHPLKGLPSTRNPEYSKTMKLRTESERLLK